MIPREPTLITTTTTIMIKNIIITINLHAKTPTTTPKPFDDDRAAAAETRTRQIEVSLFYYTSRRRRRGHVVIFYIFVAYVSGIRDERVFSPLRAVSNIYIYIYTTRILSSSPLLYMYNSSRRFSDRGEIIIIISTGARVLIERQTKNTRKHTKNTHRER